MEYNQENLELATSKVANFAANMGGTEILKPLTAALKLDTPASFVEKGGYKKMIFVLTDGET